MLDAANGSDKADRRNMVRSRTAPPTFSAADVIRTCANCGSSMEERKCKLICHGCGYFLSCADYY